MTVQMTTCLEVISG